MPIMTRMRDSMPVILIALVVAFLLTIVFEWGMDYLDLRSRGGDYVGKINARTVSYQEFTELVRQAADNQKAQTNVEPDDNQLSQIRDQVWNSLVNQTLIEKELQRLGITVTDQEIVEWVRGPDPPDFLRRQFVDSTGVFNRAAYEQAIQNPQNKEVWITVEGMVRQQRLQEKLQSVLFASVRATESEIFRRYADQNARLDVEYILFDPNRLIKDEEVQVTEVDIRKFYNEHPEDYRVQATRKLKYMVFSDAPSAQDTQGVLDDIEDVLRQVRQGADFVETAGLYGQVQNSDAFFKPGELSQAKEDVIFRAQVGDVIGPIRDADEFHVVKIVGERLGKEEFVRASHILVSIENNDSAKALKQAHELVAAARSGEPFEELAKKHSRDPGSAARGGDLGWFGKGRMVKEFENAAFKAKVGQVIGPVKTQFGYHVIKVLHRTRREVRIADLSLPVRPSSQTRTAIYQKAQDFAYLAKENGFAEAATQVGFNVMETLPFTEDPTIPGFGVNPALSKFAWEGKVGEISDVISVQSGYAVFMIAEAKPTGIRPLDEVKDAIRTRAIREKKMERLKALAEEIRNKLQPSDSLGKGIAGMADLQVQHTGQFSPGGFVPGLGRELAFIGAASSLEVGKVSKPVEGLRGYYLLRLLARNEIDSAAFQSQRPTLMAQTAQEKRNQFISEWLERLRKKADIEDNRDLFFR